MKPASAATPPALSPELRALIARTPVARSDADLSPELRALIQGRPLPPAAGQSSADPLDDIFAFLGGRHTVPRGYRGRRVAVLRGIGPHNIVYYLIGAVIGIAIWPVLYILITIFTWLASLIT